PARAAREMHRVLRPGGELLFAEHGTARSVRAQRWQRRIEPVWTPLAGGCHLTRNPPQILRDAGFAVDWAERLLDPRLLAARTIGPLTYGYWGVAHWSAWLPDDARATRCRPATSARPRSPRVRSFPDCRAGPTRRSCSLPDSARRCA